MSENTGKHWVIWPVPSADVEQYLKDGEWEPFSVVNVGLGVDIIWLRKQVSEAQREGPG